MRMIIALAVISLLFTSVTTAAAPADLVILDGSVVTLDSADRVAQAVAVTAGRITAVGTNDEIRAHVGPATRIVQLKGQSVVPGFIESHIHAIGVARAELQQQYAELTSIAAIQNWIRQQAKTTKPGEWIRVPRNEITRLDERRFPTVAELDAAAPDHPVRFLAVTHYVLNSAGLKRVGITDDTKEITGGKIQRDERGKIALLLDAAAFMSRYEDKARDDVDATLAMLKKVLAVYNSVGITTIFERATDKAGWLTFQTLKERGELTARVVATFRSQFKNGADVEKFVRTLGLKTNGGDEWVKAGPLKITVDGGIHWGTTWLTEPYGPKRANFYFRPDPQWRGDQRYTVEQMTDIFAAAHRSGWQMSAHVTGDGGMQAVLEALEKSSALTPAAPHRFNLIHAYFPNPQLVSLAKKLNVGVDTQGYLYYRDAEFIHDVYGPEWAQRFMGLKTWLDAGVPVATNSDHMIGLDPDHAMNSFNPMLMAWIAVARKSDRGNVHGESQKLTRSDALRCLSTHAAWLSFDEKNRGTIEPGKLADLTLLDRDYLTCPEDDIRHIKVTHTIVGGKTVFER